jgi:hypothetical protein
MLPMESDYVGVSSSASIWAADLHRSICEWEVRLPTMRRQSSRLTTVSLSGLDTYETLDTTHLYHEHDYRALPPALETPDGYAHGDFAYASHGSDTSLSGKLITPAVLLDISGCHSALFTPCALLSASRSLHCRLEAAMPVLLGRWLSMSSELGPIACSGSEARIPVHVTGRSHVPSPTCIGLGRCVCGGTQMLG